MKKIDHEGTVFLLTDDRYDYRIIATEEAGVRIMLRDDGCRIEGLYIDELPHNEPLGEREWVLVAEYKQCDYPGMARAVVRLIMGQQPEA